MAGGRPTLFPGAGHRVNGSITEKAEKVFERVRALISKLSGRGSVSDGNVVEVLARAADLEDCSRVILTVTDRK